MKPALLILSFSPIASDARLLKQIDAFRDRFAITTVGYGEDPAGVDRHIRIPDDRVYWRYDRLAVLLRQYRRAYRTNPAVSFVRDAVERSAYDVILANDIDTVGVALELAPHRGVHADLHEYAPRQKEDVPRWRLFVAPFMTWMCRRFLPRASSVTTVGHGIAREYARRFGVAVDVVTNSAPYAELAPSAVEGPIRLVHSGACLPDRGIDEIVDAVRRTRARVTLDLYLMPNDPAYLETLRRMAHGDARITIHDAVPYAQLISTLNSHDVGIHILPPVNFNHAWALPNKFFDYVQARLGLIIGPSPEMKAVVEEYGVGTVAAGFTADDLRAVLDELTAARVEQWKTASAGAAQTLSAAAQVTVWQEKIDTIVAEVGE